MERHLSESVSVEARMQSTRQSVEKEFKEPERQGLPKQTAHSIQLSVSVASSFTADPVKDPLSFLMRKL